MKYIQRHLENSITQALNRGKSVLLFGARQTGKTTLIERLKSDVNITLIRKNIRLQYEKDASLLIREIEELAETSKGKKPLVIIDEVQKVPDILDSVQYLLDKKVAQFVLTGSSARKLKHRTDVNLLPGRVVVLRLDPYTLQENPPNNLEERLIFGALPGILTSNKPNERDIDLESYVETYLEEEIRAEAIVRNIGSFARFLELAASESGSIINLHKLSTAIGVSHTTIASYYQILDDCLIAHRIEPITQSKTRKKLTKSQKYLVFDLGVRRVAAREGRRLPQQIMGALFEQFVGLELIRLAKLSKKKTTIKFWRDPDGPEVDWVIDQENKWTPIEVKWTDNPSPRDIKHMKVFLQEYPNAQKGYVVCRCQRRLKLSKSITAIPWQELSELIT